MFNGIYAQSQYNTVFYGHIQIKHPPSLMQKQRQLAWYHPTHPADTSKPTALTQCFQPKYIDGMCSAHSRPLRSSDSYAHRPLPLSAQILGSVVQALADCNFSNCSFRS